MKKPTTPKDTRTRQHAKGKLTVEERLALLIDEGSFLPLRPEAQLRSTDFNLSSKKTPGDGVVTGQGKIEGRKVFVYAQDVTCMGGSLGEIHAAKICQLYDLALSSGTPVVALIDSGGARIQEGLLSLDGYAGIFQRMVRASGIIPQISVVLGPAAGGAAYAPALSDFVFVVEELSTLFITGPQIIAAATGEKIDAEGLGGTAVHSKKSGVTHFVSPDEASTIEQVRQLLRFLPDNALDPAAEEAFEAPTATNLAQIVPEDAGKAYDIKQVIAALVDEDSFMEIQSAYARNAVIGLARLAGKPVGIVANQPSVLAGCLDINSSGKIARFVRFCDAFRLPLVNLVDVPGYLPGVEQEHEGIIRHGAKVLYAYAEATVPKVAVVLRKAYGGGYIALASRALGYDLVYAWPHAELAVMGAKQAVGVIYRREIAEKGKAHASKLEATFAKRFLNPKHAAALGQIDQIIAPEATRATLIQSLALLEGKRVPRLPRQHGSGPQ